MSEVKYKSVSLTTMFTVGRGLPKYTKSYADQNKGVYPVYSSKTEGDGVFARINTYDYDGEFLTWSTDGYAGIPAYRNGKFSCTDHCGILILKEEFDKIYLPYIRWQIDFRQLRRGYNNQRVKVNQVKNATLFVKIPIDNNGDYDFEKQKELAEKYQILEEQKRILLAKAKEIEKISVLFPQGKDVVKKELKDIFISISRGKSKYTKTFCKENLGEYPLYSADNEKPLGMMNCYDYEGEYLTISINGIAGKITILNGCFSTNADRVVCVPKDNIVAPLSA